MTGCKMLSPRETVMSCLVSSKRDFFQSYSQPNRTLKSVIAMTDSRSKPGAIGIRRILLTTFICMLTFFGCGPSPLGSVVVPASGTITLDGRPVANARIIFESESGARSFGRSDGSGAFELVTESGDPGSPTGKFIVRVRSTDETVFVNTDTPVKFDRRYEVSGVRSAMITEDSENVFPLELVSKPDQSAFPKSKATQEGA